MPSAGRSTEICGFLVVDKPAGLSSHACVARVRRAFGLKRVGHGGTLDPAVTGVLPMALGMATRLLAYLPGEKTYRASLQLGIRTTTDDLQGAPLELRPLPQGWTTADVERLLERFRGLIHQRPPSVSAVHVGGQRAYALARAGQPVELPPRPVHIHRLSLLAWEPGEGRLELEACCSAGTYIRSLARDVGEAMGCGGALAQLRRTAALGFELHQSVALSDLGDPLPPLLDPLDVLTHLPRHQMSPMEVEGWRCGRSLAVDPLWSDGGPVLVVAPDGKLAGLAEMGDPGVLRPRLVLCANG